MSSEFAFDRLFAACVVHDIRRAQHNALLDQLKRLLRAGGLIVQFEHKPRDRSTRPAVNSCPYDENAESIDTRGMRRRLTTAPTKDGNIRSRIFFAAARA